MFQIEKSRFLSKPPRYIPSKEMSLGSFMSRIAEMNVQFQIREESWVYTCAKELVDLPRISPTLQDAMRKHLFNNKDPALAGLKEAALEHPVDAFVWWLCHNIQQFVLVDKENGTFRVDRELVEAVRVCFRCTLVPVWNPDMATACLRVVCAKAEEHFPSAAAEFGAFLYDLAPQNAGNMVQRSEIVF